MLCIQGLESWSVAELWATRKVMSLQGRLWYLSELCLCPVDREVICLHTAQVMPGNDIEVSAHTDDKYTTACSCSVDVRHPGPVVAALQTHHVAGHTVKIYHPSYSCSWPRQVRKFSSNLGLGAGFHLVLQFPQHLKLASHTLAALWQKKWGKSKF